MDAAEIIARLEERVDDEPAVYDELRDGASGQALVEAFARAEDPWTRTLLAGLLGDRAEPAALEPLLAALGDPDEQLRWAVVDALGKLLRAEPATRHAGSTLLARYEIERSARVRAKLVSALGAAGYEPAVPALRSALEDGAPAVAFMARQALHRLEGSPPVTAGDIVGLLEMPGPDGRALVDCLFAEAPIGVLVEAFTRAEGPDTRQLLADLLGFRGDAAAVDVLTDALGDPDPGVRASVADALGKVVMADPPPAAKALERAGAALLARFETEPEAGTRRTLASAVGAARYRPALPALRAALAGDDRSLAYSAGWGLHWLEGTPPPTLPR